MTSGPPFAHKPTIVGASVTLRPFQDEDLPHLQSAMSDPEVVRLTGSEHTTQACRTASTPEEALRQWYSTRHEQTDRLDLMVIDNASGSCVGEVVLNEWDPGNESCNLRILLGPAGQGRGLGTEAIRLLLGHAFAQLPLHRIDLEVYAFNPRAQHVYDKVGFVVEGRRRDALVFDGERIDAVVMSVLRPEWLARQA